MLSCKEIVKALNSEEQLSLTKRMEIRMHLLMCGNCSAYSKHLAFLKKGMRKLFKDMTQTEPEKVKRLEDEILKKVK